MSGPAREKSARLLRSAAESPWFAYAALVALQLKVMLWMWEYRDLTPGDTSYYYVEVYHWLDEGRASIINSPVYTLFLAGLHSLLENPFWVMTVAQILIAVSASVLVLALLNRLLPSHIAWFIAAWWALLPINFDTFYNVHLFSFLFPLGLFVVAAYADQVYGRGIVLGGLLFTALLIRIEYGALFIAWLLIVTCQEVYACLKESPRPLRTYCIAYGIPVLLAVLITSVFYMRYTGGFPELQEELQAKQTFSLGQVYAYNKRQQGGDWQGNPWYDYEKLLERDFGKPTVTFAQAFSLNPRAMLEHIWWNIKLIPSGTQLALFNSYGGRVNPDYVRARHAPLVWLPFLLVMALSVLAVVTRFMGPGKENLHSFKNRSAWLLMFSAALFTLGIMAVQHPRPSYMFPYTLLVMALTGLGVDRLFGAGRTGRALASWWPAAGVLLVLSVSPYYDSRYINHFGYKTQPLRDKFEGVWPSIERGTMRNPAVITTPIGDYTDLCNYLGVICSDTAPAGSSSAESIGSRSGIGSDNVREGNTYLMYLEEMIMKYSVDTDHRIDVSNGYVELNCFSIADGFMKCSDGKIDLENGFMNDGSVAIPLRGAVFVNNGYIVDQKKYNIEQGYYLQILMQNGSVKKILVAGELLFFSPFNQKYLLGNYDRSILRNVSDEYPSIRIFKSEKKNAVL